MANQYGDETEPGIITEETSADNIVSSGGAPSDICVVGPADLANATNAATEDTVYRITRDSTATERFGPASSSLLTTAVLDQLREGAAPVYAVAPPSTDVTAEDHSGDGTTTIDLANEPTSEDPDDFTVDLDGTTLTVLITHEDVSTKSPAADEAYVNPVEGQMEVETAPSTTLDVDYTHFDYATALDSIEANQQASEAVDFLTAIQETAAVQQDVAATVDSLAGEQKYALALVAPDAARIDPDNYTNSYDSSRVQVVYPTRFEDGTSALAAYAGKRASLSLSRTAIRQSLSTDKQLAVKLTKAERGTLIANNVVPMENRTSGAVIRDDPTSVTSDNTDEANINYGFKRMALDYVYDVVEANEEPFIGRLHKDSVRNALADLIADQLAAIQNSDIIEAYNVRIFEVSATKARLEIDIDAPEPLRFIVNDASVGSVE